MAENLSEKTDAELRSLTADGESAMAEQSMLGTSDERTDRIKRGRWAWGEIGNRAKAEPASGE